MFCFLRLLLPLAFVVVLSFSVVLSFVTSHRALCFSFAVLSLALCNLLRAFPLSSRVRFVSAHCSFACAGALRAQLVMVRPHQRELHAVDRHTGVVRRVLVGEGAGVGEPHLVSPDVRNPYNASAGALPLADGGTALWLFVADSDHNRILVLE